MRLTNGIISEFVCIADKEMPFYYCWNRKKTPEEKLKDIAIEKTYDLQFLNEFQLELQFNTTHVQCKTESEMNSLPLEKNSIQSPIFE